MTTTLDEAWAAVEAHLPPSKGWGLTIRPKWGINLLRYHLSGGPGLEYRAYISRENDQKHQAHGSTPVEALEALLVQIKGVDPDHAHDFIQLDGTRNWVNGPSSVRRCACGAEQLVSTEEKVTTHWPDRTTTWPDGRRT